MKPSFPSTLARLGCTLAVLFAFPLPGHSEIVVLHETFDDDAAFTKEDGGGLPTSFFSDGDDVYFGIGDGDASGDYDGDPVPTGALAFPFQDGWALLTRNLGLGTTTTPVAVVWSDLAVTGLEELTVEIDFVEAAPSGAFDAADLVRGEVALDDGSWEILFEARADAVGELRIDTDLDGVGDGHQIRSLPSTLSFAVAGTASTLDLRVSVELDETFLVDDVRVVGRRRNEWIVLGPADFFVGGNWSLGHAPQAGEDAYVRNGGTSVGTGDPTAPTDLDLGLVLVGDENGGGSLAFSGVDLTADDVVDVAGAGTRTPLTFDVDVSGALTLTAADTFATPGELRLLDVLAGSDLTVGASGTLEISDIDEVDIGEDLVIASSIAVDGATVVTEGSAAFRDLARLSVIDAIEIATSNVDTNASGTPRTRAEQTVDVLFEDIVQLESGDGLYVTDHLNDPGTDTVTAVDVTLRRVGATLQDLVVVIGDTNGVGAEGSTHQLDTQVALEEAIVEVEYDLELHDVVVLEDGGVDSTVRFLMTDSTLTAHDYGIMGRLAGGGGPASNAVVTEVELVRSGLLHTNELLIGVRLDATPGTLTTDVILDEASRLETPSLHLGADASLRIHVDGDASVLDGTVGDPDTHSAASVTDALLEGEVVAVFDTVPTAGTHVYDLLVTGSATALDDATAGFTVEGLDPAFTVDAFGVVEDGTDRVRLAISGTLTADLSITKTDGSETVVAGDVVVYTVTVANDGPSRDPAARVVDAFPATLDCSWTSLATGGATGASTGSGGADLDDTLDLPSGATVVYTMTCTLDPSATGTLENTATVTGSWDDPSPGDGSATDTSTVVLESDLGITVDDLTEHARAGDLLVYTLVVDNAGPSDAWGAAVTDLFPESLLGCTWECLGTDGAVCSVGPVDGDVVDTVDLPAGSYATYAAGCQIDPALDSAVAAIENTATVAPPAGVTDPSPGNDTATDVTAIVLFADGFESGDLDAWSAAQP